MSERSKCKTFLLLFCLSSLFTERGTSYIFPIKSYLAKCKSWRLHPFFLCMVLRVIIFYADLTNSTSLSCSKALSSSTLKHRFSYDHWSKQMLSSIITWMFKSSLSTAVNPRAHLVVVLSIPAWHGCGRCPAGYHEHRWISPFPQNSGEHQK